MHSNRSWAFVHLCVPWLELRLKETIKSMLSEATGSVESETKSESASGSDVVSLNNNNIIASVMLQYNYRNSKN